MQYAAFWNAKDRLLVFIRSLGVWQVRVLYVYFLLQSRQSVTVIPRSDAESSVCSLHHFTPSVFSGFRVGARHDGYRPPGSKLHICAYWLYIPYTQTGDDPLLSDYYFLLEVRFAEFRGRAVFLTLEYAVEVGQVVEAALVANLGYRHGSVYQQARRVAKAYVDDVVR